MKKEDKVKDLERKVRDLEARLDQLENNREHDAKRFSKLHDLIAMLSHPPMVVRDIPYTKVGAYDNPLFWTGTVGASYNEEREKALDELTAEAQRLGLYK